MADSDIKMDALREQIECAVQHVVFTDAYKNRVNSFTIGEFYKKNRRFALTSADSISVPESQLTRLVSELDASVGIYKSSKSGKIGNGLYHLKGSLASPRLPSIENYAKMLVLAASRIGSERVTELFAEWLQGKGIRARLCALLKGILTEGKLAPANGLHLETLPANGDDFPKSLRIDQDDIRQEQFANRAILSIEQEIASPLPLYDPQASHESKPESLRRYNLVNPELSSITIESFCRAMSLATNNHVDWFIYWWDYGDVEAFFLNPGFSSRRKEINAPSPILISEADARYCLEIHSWLHGFSNLDLAIARWRKSKQPTWTHDQFIELRIALESVLLNDDRSFGEKKHRLAIRGAWLLGDTFEERKECFETLRIFYDYASSVIHAGSPKEKNQRGLPKTISDAQNLCRDAMLRIAQEKALPNWTDVILNRVVDS